MTGRYTKTFSVLLFIFLLCIIILFVCFILCFALLCYYVSLHYVLPALQFNCACLIFMNIYVLLVYGFLFRSQELEYFFFFAAFPEFNIKHYVKNSESDYFFFPPPKSEYFFQQHWESEYFFRKNHTE